MQCIHTIIETPFEFPFIMETFLSIIMARAIGGIFRVRGSFVRFSFSFTFDSHCLPFPLDFFRTSHGKSLRRLAPSFPPGKGILDPYLFLGLHVAINGFILSLASRDIKISFPPSRMKRSTDREKEREERAKRNWSNGVRR